MNKQYQMSLIAFDKKKLSKQKKYKFLYVNQNVNSYITQIQNMTTTVIKLQFSTYSIKSIFIIVIRNK